MMMGSRRSSGRSRFPAVQAGQAAEEAKPQWQRKAPPRVAQTGVVGRRRRTGRPECGQ